MSRMSGIITFIAGAAVGAAASWYFTKNKYEQIIQEEIDSGREAFFDTPSSEEQDEDAEDPEDSRSHISARVVRDKATVDEFVTTVENYGYTKYSDSEKKELERMTEKKPYVIPPEEFGEIEEYSRCSLTYYADKVLADELDELVENINDTIGFESLTHFGEYEADSVFVRNDRLRCDYEILLDTRTYIDVLRAKPYKESFYDGWPTE